MAGEKGLYLLENYGIPHKDPIIISRETGEHWLALEHHNEQVTVLTFEFNADNIVALTAGKNMQITKVITTNSDGLIDIYVTVTNRDLTPVTASVGCVKCQFAVPDSTNVTHVVAPQLSEVFHLQSLPGQIELVMKISCTVVVSTEKYGVVAQRQISIKPLQRCICYMHCQCMCFGEQMKCIPLGEEDYHSAGFLGSLPISTMQPPFQTIILEHKRIILLFVLIVLLLIGFGKAVFGLIGFTHVRDFGLKSRIYGRKNITGSPTPVLTERLIFVLNVLFIFIWPWIKLCDKCRSPRSKPPSDYESVPHDDTDDDQTEHFSIDEELTDGTEDLEYDDFDLKALSRDDPGRRDPERPDRGRIQIRRRAPSHEETSFTSKKTINLPRDDVSSTRIVTNGPRMTTSHPNLQSRSQQDLADRRSGKNSDRTGQNSANPRNQEQDEEEDADRFAAARQDLVLARNQDQDTDDEDRFAPPLSTTASDLVVVEVPSEPLDPPASWGEREWKKGRARVQGIPRAERKEE